jgi:SET domain-containing protein
VRPTVASWITPKASKGSPSSIEGRGVHALVPIAAGEVVAVKGGHIVDRATVESLPESIRKSEFQIADDLFLAALNEDEYEAVMMFVNHSCDPNVGMAGNVVLVARRDISPGDELTIDYALFDDSDEVMECRCGTAGCRRTITGRDWARPDLRERYRGSFSWWVERKIEQSALNPRRD